MRSVLTQQSSQSTSLIFHYSSIYYCYNTLFVIYYYLIIVRLSSVLACYIILKIAINAWLLIKLL